MDAWNDQKLGTLQDEALQLAGGNGVLTDGLDAGVSPLLQLGAAGQGGGGAAAPRSARQDGSSLGGLYAMLGGAGGGGGGGRGDVGASEADDVQQLVQATLNEKNAPEILQFRQQLLDRVEDRLTKQEEHCEAIESELDQELTRMMLNLEVRRIRYLVKLYHRTRLQKIEKLAAAVMDSVDLQERLSSHELKYCRGYFTLVGKHLTDTVLQHLPAEFQSMFQVHTGGLSKANDLIPQALLDSHVFCKLLEDAGSVTPEDGTSVDMLKDDVYMLRYRPVAHLVASQQAVLI